MTALRSAASSQPSGTGSYSAPRRRIGPASRPRWVGHAVRASSSASQSPLPPAASSAVGSPASTSASAATRPDAASPTANRAPVSDPASTNGFGPSSRRLICSSVTAASSTGLATAWTR